MTPFEILDEAQNLLKPRNAWTQNAYGRNERDTCVPLDEATCFCTVGAVAKVSGYRHGTTVADNHPAIQSLLAAGGFKHIGQLMIFNDARSTSKADILNLFDRAKELTHVADPV